jgi:hypothetical protein
VNPESCDDTDESLVEAVICLLLQLFLNIIALWCDGDPFVDEPADEIEHIELFREPIEPFGDDGGVWKVNPSAFMSLMTCSETGGSLNGSSVDLDNFWLISSNCWKSVTIEASASKTGLREATKVQ